jgi:hypothetical protein
MQILLASKSYIVDDYMHNSKWLFPRVLKVKIYLNISSLICKCNWFILKEFLKCSFIILWFQHDPNALMCGLCHKAWFCNKECYKLARRKHQVMLEEIKYVKYALGPKLLKFKFLITLVPYLKITLFSVWTLVAQNQFRPLLFICGWYVSSN